MAFTNEQMERYSRHIILQEVGVKGQKKLLNGKVLIYPSLRSFTLSSCEGSRCGAAGLLSVLER